MIYGSVARIRLFGSSFEYLDTFKGNGLTVALGSGGTLSATYMSNPGNRTDLVFDVSGYYAP